MAQIIQSKRYLTPANKSLKVANSKATSSYNSYLSAALVRIDSAGTTGKPTVDTQSIFLLNPESWSENKSAHWAQQVIPGQSDPILQWISSGPRTITFDALVTRDIATSVKPQVVSRPISKNFFATIAAKVFNAPVAFRGDTNTSSLKGLAGILDISDYLNYYRALLYPIYDDKNNILKSSPPLVMLVTGSTFEDNPIVNTVITPKSTVWVVTNLRITITKQLPNLAPLEATVNFELMQYTLNSFDKSMFIY